MKWKIQIMSMTQHKWKKKSIKVLMTCRNNSWNWTREKKILAMLSSPVFVHRNNGIWRIKGKIIQLITRVFLGQKKNIQNMFWDRLEVTKWWGFFGLFWQIKAQSWIGLKRGKESEILLLSGFQLINFNGTGKLAKDHNFLQFQYL